MSDRRTVRPHSAPARAMAALLLAVATALPGVSPAYLRAADIQASAVESNVDLPLYPAISPDGKTIAFSWRGDVWTVPAAGGGGNGGGLATRITTSPYDDLYPVFSPDGKKLAFVSTRVGANNLFTINLDGTDLTQVTFSDRPLLLTQWTKDEKGEEKLFFSSIQAPSPFAGVKSYCVSPEGGDITDLFPAVGNAPCVSPDGKKILFMRGNSPWERRGYRGSQNRDLWLFDKATSKYTRLTAFDGNDGKPRWLDDSTVVFISDRLNNTYNLFTLKVGDSDESAKPLTSFDGDGIDDFDLTPGTGTLVFSRWDRLYTLDARARGTPAPLPIRASEEEADRVRFQSAANTVSECALSPDGKAVAIISFGELYVRGTDAKAPTRRITTTLAGRKRDVTWSADGTRVLFVCDATGREEIYAATVKLTRTELRRKADPSLAGAEETPREAPPRETPAGAATQPATQPATNPPVTPEGEFLESDPMADQVRRVLPPGLVPSAGAAGPAPALPPTDLSRWGDAISFDTKKLWDASSATGLDRHPTPSPDGRTLAFLRDRGTLILHDELTGRDRVLVSNFDDIDFRFSPDSRYIAYSTEDRNNNADIWIVPVDGSEKPVNVTRHPSGDYAPRFSADGKVLAFLSNRAGTGDETTVYSVYLDKDLEALAAPELDAYYRDAAAASRRRTPPATRPSSTQPSSRATSLPTSRRASTRALLKKADLEDAYLRIRRWTNVRGSISDLELSPAGDRIYFVGFLGSTRGLLSQTREAPEPTRIANSVNIQHLSLTGDAMAAVDAGPPAPAEGGAPRGPGAGGGGGNGGGRAAVIRLPAGETEYYDPADRLKVDLQKLSEQKFLEASRVLGAVFYDPKMNGVDWPALTAKYLPLARNARTANEFNVVANKFIGQLNASHLGIAASSPPSALSQPAGRLGIQTTRTPEGLRVEDVTPEGPADHGVMRLKKGDLLTAIDFSPIGPRDTLEKLLLGKTGVETVVSLKRDGRDLDLLLTPASYEALTALAYNRWRLDTLEKVIKLSGGKIGYIHIQGMNEASLETYKRDLYAACDGRQGMIVDVRWNGGGSTADLLLTSLMSPYHAYTVPRGAPAVTDSYPGDRLYIPRFVGPVNMLCNERSFSNAEIISHAFKTLKRGTLVGNQTAGGVISTGATTLLDGTSLRLPGRGWYTPDGTNMELRGALPDILVVQTPEDEANNDDPQLKAAVDDLLKRLR